MLKQGQTKLKNCAKVHSILIILLSVYISEYLASPTHYVYANKTTKTIQENKIGRKPNSEKLNFPGEPLNPDDFKRARIYDHNIKPEENSNQDNNLDPSKERLDRIFGRDLPQKWKNGRVPYEISSEFTVDERTIITSAAMEFSSKTEGCINWVSRVPVVLNQQMERDYVNITKGGGQYCSSFMGKRGRGQVLNLAPYCLSRGIIVHEMMHVLGLDHEHQRSDRDKYIEIKYENIITDLIPQFENFNDTWNERTSAYDYGSILHYSDDASCNQSPCRVKTIIIRDDPGSNLSAAMGQRNALSKLDLEKIDKLYRCKERKPIDMVNNVLPTRANGRQENNNGKSRGTSSTRNCVDFDTRCKLVIASRDCTENRTWTNYNCRKTCGNCDTNCQDFNEKCQAWSLGNGCQEYPEYMLQYCPKSCALCV